MKLNCFWYIWIVLELVELLGLLFFLAGCAGCVAELGRADEGQFGLLRLVENCVFGKQKSKL